MPRRLAPSAIYPAADAGLSSRHVTTASGLRVRVVEYGPDAGPPVLFVHGWACSAWLFRKNVGALGDAGYRAIAVDLKGHGLSDKPTAGAEYTLEAMTAHVLEVLDALGLERVALVGHSMGGAIVVNAALERPGRVERVAALSPVGFGRVRLLGLWRFLTPRAVVPIVRRAMPRWSVTLALRLVSGRGARWTLREVDEYWAPSQFPEYADALWALLHGFRWTPIDRQALERLRVPMLIIRGARDPVLRASEAERSACEPSNVEVITVPAAGHLTPDEAPDLVNRELLRFLARAGGP